SFGIEPLLVTEDDLFEHLAAGNVVSAPGVFVSKISEKAKTFGLTEGDQILAIDDRPLKESSQVAIFSKNKAIKDVDVTVASRDGVIKKLHVPLLGKDKTFGVGLKPFTELPRLAVYEIKPGSTSAKAGLQVGDVIVKMNGQNVYYPSDFDDILTESGSVTFSVLRGTQTLEIPVVLPDSKKVIVADVFDGSVAQKAGFQPRDVIVNIQGMDITTPQQVVDVLKQNAGKELVYRILRGTSTLEIKTTREDKKELGIALSLLASYKNSEISVYRSSVITSFTEIKKVHYAPWTAFKKAISESVRLTGITVQAFGNTIGSIISKFTVPGDVGGPVQIAYYTHTFVQEGFFALLRFAALLSLSLAVINVLPIPALDGGRLLFIVVEVIFRRRVNARLEAMVHTIGFVLLLVMIGLVTYSDIVKLF
ncbi:MAG: PDZ domain-containing protein, partial [Patescibacteria group bacterium]